MEGPMARMITFRWQLFYYASQTPALVRLPAQGRPLNFNQRADFDLSLGDCAQILRVRLRRRGCFGRSMRGGAVHDDARRKIAGVEVGISLLFLRHHFVDLIAKDAAHICDQLRKRVCLRLATDCTGPKQPHRISCVGRIRLPAATVKRYHTRVLGGTKRLGTAGLRSRCLIRFSGTASTARPTPSTRKNYDRKSLRRFSRSNSWRNVKEWPETDHAGANNRRCLRQFRIGRSRLKEKPRQVSPRFWDCEDWC